MAYPARSTFRTGNRGDAWWHVIDGGHPQFVQWQGDNVVRLLQAKLQQHVLREGLLSTDGEPIYPQQIHADGAWGPLTQRGVAAAAMEYDVEAPVLAALQHDLRARIVGPQSLRVGLWLALYRPAVRNGRTVPEHIPLAGVRLPANVIAPSWGRAGGRPAHDAYAFAQYTAAG